MNYIINQIKMKTTERKEDASKFMNPPNDVMRKIVKKVSDSKLFNPNSKEAMVSRAWKHFESKLNMLRYKLFINKITHQINIIQFSNNK